MKIYKVKVNGKVYEVELESVSEAQGSIKADAPKAEAAPAAPVASGAGVEVKAPMQGKILDVKVKVGDAVAKGQVVAILEAMKLENEIISPADGKVLSVVVNKDQTVNNNDLLIVIG
ncbi:MAG: biotin/lipoyl-binding protein [Bacilli bacterium]|nr:biotin/lipoyl-binding protein [Bacilli bacterium]